MTVLSILALSLSQAQPYSIPYDGGTLKLERLASLEYPWGICGLPDGRVLITEKPGRLRIFHNGQLSAPVSGVPEVSFYDQGGLHDVERDPNFAQNQLVYIYFVEAAEVQTMIADAWDPRIGPKPKTGVNSTLKGGAVARGKLVGNSLEDVRVIWRQNPKTIGRGHFGGRLIWDSAGRLYVTSGDRQRFTPAQDMGGNLGKIVRINRDGSIPRDNPYPGRDLWSIGHRNPLGGAFDSAGRLWIHEMGPLGGDEFNRITAKRNYGWPVVSNGNNYDQSPIPDHDTRPRFTKPAVTWNPVISPSGMIFYTGGMFPEWRGQALLGGLSSMSLIRVSVKNGIPKEEGRIKMFRRIRDVHQAPDGSLWLLVDAKSGGMLRVSKE